MKNTTNTKASINVIDSLFHENLPFSMIEQLAGVDRKTVNQIADEWDDAWESTNQSVPYDEQRSTDWFI